MVLANSLAKHALLSPEDVRAISELPFDLRIFPAGSYLFREGDAPKHNALLVSGFAFQHKLNQNGARQILSLHLPGDALGLQNLFLDMSDHNVQTLSQADVAIIPRAALAELARTRIAIARAITTSLLIEASISREWLLNVGRRDARARTAHLLCELGIRLTTKAETKNPAYELPMTQEQLGDALGLTSVHVNRTLRELERDGLLARTARSLSFPDWERLRQVAGFSPGYLHLKQKPT